ncbi:MAG TPA: lamin tail domain-containing protein, partial [Flavitalea sp.]|nr:lamin tail domain-containing protein [Flavitalea sp.]
MKTLLLIICAICNFYVKGQPARYAIVINEIMADPTPVNGLPPYEYIELKNTSADTFNLFQFMIRVGNTTSTFKSYVLLPGDYVIVCATAAVSFFTGLNVIGLPGFPALDNDGALIQLLSTQGDCIHAIEYTKAWYRSVTKSDGGWSLEMIDATVPCGGSGNWKASVDPEGGTPGYTNSVNAIQPDTTSPRMVRSVTIDSITIMAIFDEPLDRKPAELERNYVLNGQPVIIKAELNQPLFCNVTLTCSQPMKTGIVYELEARSIRDCSGNEIGSFNRSKAGLPISPNTSDLVINELLFNPPAGGTDFVELFNRSKKIIDLKSVYISGRNATGQLQLAKPFTTDPFFCFPGDFIVLSNDPDWLQRHYLVQQPDCIIKHSGMPAFPDESGDVVLLNTNGDILDEIKYSEKWHFPLLEKNEGVSLERIRVDLPTQDPSNWNSATYTAGFATPTYLNSQARATENSTAAFTVIPSFFSPDQDGNEDITMIEYRLPSAGYMGTITVYDSRGRSVCSLVKNRSLSAHGFFKWNGLNESGIALPSGIYIVQMEVFDLKGNRKKFTKAVTLA